MKKIDFKGIKLACFMLVACLTLTICATSCSSDDEFETNLPEEPKQLSKAELIEQALSRMPQTRVNDSRVEMVTIKDSVSIRFTTTGPIEIHWDEDTTISVTAGTNVLKTHKFSDGHPSYSIRITGTEQAIQNLTVDNNELISLDIKSNENLTTLNCRNNHLDAIDLSGCKNLGALAISNNEFTSIDLTCLPELQSFHAVNNWLTELNLSANSNLFDLYIENNRIKELDLSENQILYILEAQNNPLRILKLKSDILGYMDVSYSQLTDLDLRECKALWAIILEGTPIERLNNDIIRDTSFVFFTELQQLNLAYTSSLTGLNLSVNPNVFLIDISGASITRLDISGGQIGYLYATRSKLTNLMWGGSDGLANLYEVRIENTPFEKDSTKISKFVSDLPPRSYPGHLYTYSRYINDFVDAAFSKNWLINQ